MSAIPACYELRVEVPLDHTGTEALAVAEALDREGWVGPPDPSAECTPHPFHGRSARPGVVYAWHEQPATWEDLEDLKGFTKRFPEALFVLDSSGDEADLNWRAYYRDGREQLVWPQTTYAPFDESKLG
jgi:hypothetical protein